MLNIKRIFNGILKNQYGNDRKKYQKIIWFPSKLNFINIKDNNENEVQLPF